MWLKDHINIKFSIVKSYGKIYENVYSDYDKGIHCEWL